MTCLDGRQKPLFIADIRIMVFKFRKIVKNHSIVNPVYSDIIMTDGHIRAIYYKTLKSKSYTNYCVYGQIRFIFNNQFYQFSFDYKILMQI